MMKVEKIHLDVIRSPDGLGKRIPTPNEIPSKHL